jgi:signal transduction histidine kinase
MPNGGELKICSQLFESRSASLLKLCVSDTGCGIPEADLERVQEPFVTTKTQGTGLGIPICKKIIEAHNGSLEISSKLNEGTTVEITIPIKNP